MFTATELRFLFDCIKAHTGESGWSDKDLPDGSHISSLQMKLSILLETASKVESQAIHEDG